MADDDPLLSYGEVSALTGLSPSALRRYRTGGHFPEPDARPVPDRPRWRKSTIEAWLASRPGSGSPGRPRPDRRKDARAE
jgi:predicted DNA-binding transcriptional regulator AlpA